ncbi:hypothetical protein ACFYRN_39220 [Streptomyces sp. NPDC005227]|uniref:hypothetical protein n=1 Tax=unclassified Streptomyces TaxID=2593676 RepID=UPI0036846902
MRARTVSVAILLVLTAFAAGCGRRAGHEPVSTTDGATAVASPTDSAAAARRPCVDAIAESPSGPVPDVCKSLSETQYALAYVDGVDKAEGRG